MRTGTIAIIAALVIGTALASGPTAFADDQEPLIAPVCPADLNADSIVDRADLDRLLRFYGARKGCEEDLNQDDFVDDADVAILTRQWGPCRPEGDVFGGDRSNGDADLLTGDADSRTGPDKYRATTTLVEPRCDGDLNGDSIVDRHDAIQMLESFGRCRRCDEDLNDDGFVDERDMRILLADWGWCPVVTQLEQAFRASSKTVYYSPEPDSLVQPIATITGQDDTTVPEDVNDDGIVDMVDIFTVAKHVGHEPTGEKAFSDVNNDGRIDEFDIRAIAEYVISGEGIGA